MKRNLQTGKSIEQPKTIRANMILRDPAGDVAAILPIFMVY
ncbi:MAG TPA: hypothetical protein VK699_17705 [Terriglobales bacterium]|nr:hypothetical protein [Terriglobales bacterium]